jgi:oligoendopeptidase F
MTTEQSAIKRVPRREEIAVADKWDLSRLFANDGAWEAAFAEWESMAGGFAVHQGALSNEPQALADCLAYCSQVNRLGERLGNYAFLKTAEDQTNGVYQRMMGRFQNVATKIAEASSFIRPEIMRFDPLRLDAFLADEVLQPFRLKVERMVRYRPHTLGEKEEQLLAMQGEMAEATSKIFRQLHDADLKFGSVRNEGGEWVELTPSTFSQFLISPDRDVRKTAFHQFYQQFKGHQNTLAATLNGSIQTDVYYARARGYDSALAQALFADNVPLSVYDNLIATVRGHLAPVYQYYELRRQKMGLEAIHHYDTYAPILADLEVERDWDQAIELVCDSLHPLGGDYVRTLRNGLSGRWCDRYPNQGKQSGAFSYGSYDGDPYILMNYKPKVFNDVFTLTHEAGHSMHSYYSARHQPYEYYNYTIFVAEVASTFNEQLLCKHLLDNCHDDRQRAYLLNNQIDDIRATIIRQTMFAEFEKTTHAMVEAGEPLTLDAFKSVYRKLLQDYFGPDFLLDDELSLECLRIPHFYRAFYVYKYATGLSAAIALSQRVLNGGEAELNDYLLFLKSGCSKYPLDLLRDAGVELERPQSVQAAMVHFANLVDQLEQLL